MHKSLVGLAGCQVSGVVVGKGFRFGYKAAGDTQMLQELGTAHGLDVSVVSLVSSGCTDGPETVRIYTLMTDASSIGNVHAAQGGTGA